ncbi:hypothetical protein P8629_02580 [Hydrogenovibrio sp. 3SP14C1]|uniref:hypothetical protein n=1 Tax=Hydrogenovibrio sp. 3SP14C1 TaxID=3038774 RepID=UPI00241692E0|nr:hypothetical protein [Hydrogenovibrio sp. 3SP14C1]MDG4811882.1 hypothetical protein [Hydrogenovibrio sp. 3SP14C1]
MKRLQCIFFIVLWGLSYGSSAAELNRLFLTPEQRLSVDSERQDFLKKTTGSVLKTEQTSGNKAISARVNKPNSLQKPLSVSAIIITPDGTQYIRLNNDYRKLQSTQKNLKIEQLPFETQFKVDERQIVIPVGNTYLPDSKKIIKNYQYNLRNKAGETSPKTEK